MKPEMQRALVELSAFFDPDPAVVFRRVVETLAELYPGAMAMINLLDGDRLVFREVASPLPVVAAGQVRSIRLRDTWCQFAMKSLGPLLIQDAARDPRYRNARAQLLGLSRYLAVPVRTPEGEAVGTLCILDGQSQVLLDGEDVEFFSVLAMRVSAELERERVLEERLAEQRAVAERLAELNGRLVLAAEEKRRFVTTVIHDLRQPIAALRTLLHVVVAEEDPAERAESLALIDDRVLALAAMVDELLEYSRLEADQLPRRVEPVDFRALLVGVARDYEAEAADRGVTLMLDLEPDLGEGQTDRARLNHILRNLLGNAVKFSATCAPGAKPGLLHRRARVTVRACSVDLATWRVEVEDTGIGMDEALQRRVFEEFYQGPEARSSEARSGYPPGRGLGLAIVRRFCETLGGTVSVRSRPGQGSCFTLTLPRSLSLS